MSKQVYIIFLAMIVSISVVHGDDSEDQDGMILTRSQRRFQHQILRAHNHYRTRHCVRPLRLDDELSRSAQIYAEQLAKSNGFSRDDTRGAGQNIFVTTSTDYLGSIDGQEAVDRWYRGIRDYNFNQGGYSMETGAFTQLVWSNSRYLGIGIAYTNDGHSAYIVAQYLPPGNYGHEYQENVFPAQC